MNANDKRDNARRLWGLAGECTALAAELRDSSYGLNEISDLDFKLRVKQVTAEALSIADAVQKH